MENGIIDGKAVSAEIKDKLKSRIEELGKNGIECRLSLIIVGNDPASQVYVANKEKACAYCGVKSEIIRMGEDSAESEIIAVVKKLAQDKTVNGILVQLPLPKGLDEQKILSHIPAEKDVDGLTCASVGELFLGRPCLTACTPSGVMQLLKRYGIETKGKNAVVIGRSNMVGKPMAHLLMQADCTVTVCHSKTVNLKEHTLNADILVIAAGRKKFVTGDMIKPGAVVIDVGINRDENGKLCGDADFDSVSQVASLITPVPGGVGPMTVAMLLCNTVKAAAMQNGFDYEL